MFQDFEWYILTCITCVTRICQDVQVTFEDLGWDVFDTTHSCMMFVTRLNHVCEIHISGRACDV